MSEMESIRSAVNRASRRRRWQRAWVGSWQGLLAGAALWLPVFIAYKLFPIPLQAVTVTAFAGLAFVLVGFIYGFFRRLTTQETARWLDEKTHLQERLSTALELAEKPVDASWKELLISDAARHAQKLDLRKLAPLYLPKASRWALVLLAIGAGLGFVPEYRTQAHLQREKEKEVIKEVGAQIADLTRRDLQKRSPALEPVRETLASVEELGNALAKNAVTRNDALKDLASVTDRLKQELNELGRNPALKPLERAAREGNKAGANSGELQKKIDELQKSLGQNAGSPDALEKMKNELQQAQKAAAGLPGKDSPEGQAARQQMAQNLANLSQQAREMGMSLPDLDEAIAALQADQTDMFLKGLDLAMTDLEKLQEMSQALQQLQNAASKLGKDLAEQLKNGQAELAQETLEKMIQQLKTANLTPEQMQKLMEEVSKAIDPASEYGKVGECLSNAAKQMKNGEKPGAAKSLAEASEELKKLMEQMNDAQQLMASLENLKIAQMCVGNCQSWGSCNKPGGFKPGGKPGGGVGTWADETGWIQIPESTAGWDNSSIQRPDMDGRGHTDRELDLPDTLTPTKVRGQISPGGPMPSITLKGVSIKGTSTVEYKEAVSAAQSEAQSAINQDQVPKAYRGAVRDYFDDLPQ